MYPDRVELIGLSLSVWNAAFLLASLCGYFTLRVAVSAEDPPLNFVAVRYLASLYLSALGAQFFAYAFDANTSLRPPCEVSYAAYYLNPLAGPKTLYGAVVLLPVAVAVARIASELNLARALDVWTPALFVVTAVARVGCFLQGCCYGVRAYWLGVSFPAGSPVYYEQLRAGLITQGSASLGVVPTQAIEAAFLALTAAAAMKCLRASSRGTRDGAVFAAAVAAYSAFRFVIEFARGDAERGIYSGLATSQWIAVAVVAASLAALLRRVRA